MKIRRKIFRNFIEKKFDMTGRSPDFRILEKLKQTEEKEQSKRVKYQIFDEVEFS